MKRLLILGTIICVTHAAYSMDEQEKALQERKVLHSALDRLLDADPEKMWVYNLANTSYAELTVEEQVQLKESFLSRVKAVGQVVGDGNTVISLQELKSLPDKLTPKQTLMQKLTDRTTVFVGAAALSIGYLLAKR